MPVIPIVVVDTFEQAVEVATNVEHGFRHTALIHSKDLSRITKFAQTIRTTTLIVNGRSSSMGVELRKGGTAWTIAGATGEGCTTPSSFTRERRLVVNNSMNFVK